MQQCPAFYVNDIELVNIGIDYIELILCYTWTQISQNDIIGIEINHI
ncbi:hypothetical protein [Rickettsia akari]|nr:hypothetical protein [Rickettsia akari]